MPCSPRRLDQPGDLAADRGDGLLGQLGLAAGEVVVRRPERYAGLLGQVAQAHRADATGADGAGRAGDHLAAGVAAGVGRHEAQCCTSKTVVIVCVSCSMTTVITTYDGSRPPSPPTTAASSPRPGSSRPALPTRGRRRRPARARDGHARGVLRGVRDLARLARLPHPDLRPARHGERRGDEGRGRRRAPVVRRHGRRARPRARGGRAACRSRWVGHSLGGQAVPFVDHSRLDRIVTVASGTGYWRLNPPAIRWRAPLLWLGIAPVASRVAGYYPGRTAAASSTTCRPA